MKRVPVLQSLEWRIPLLGGMLLLVVIGALATAAYLEVRRTTVLAATTRVQAVSQQMASLLRSSYLSMVAGIREVGQKEDLRQYLHREDPTQRARVLSSLRYTGTIGGEPVLSVELRNLQGRTLLAWGPAVARAEQVPQEDLRRAMAAGDSAGVGAFRALGDTVVYPVYGLVADSTGPLGYLVQWRRQFQSPQARQNVNELIGPESRLLIGDSSQVYWTDLTSTVAGPPRGLLLGSDVAAPPVMRYDRAGLGGMYAAAAKAQNSPWIALVEFPEHVVVDPSQAFLHRLIAVCLGLIVLSLSATWLLSRSITRPLRELAGAADAITIGNHGSRVMVERKDELGRVAAAFNRMAEGVETSHREREERFRLFVDGVRDYAIYMLTPEGRIMTWNAGAERVKGYKESEIIGRDFSLFYVTEDVAAGKPRLNLEVAAAEGRIEDEGWRVRKDGSRFWASALITALRNQKGELLGFGKVTRDMTERRNAENALRLRTRDLDQALVQLQAAQESLVRREKLAILGQLASGVGHELRNPLGVMTNALYYLDAVMGDAPEKVKEYLGILRNQVDLSEKIVSDLLDFARVKPPQRAAVPIGEVVERQIQRAGGLGQVKIRRDIPDSLPPALADQVQVGQVVLNLLSNALQSIGDEPGTIDICARANGSGLLHLEVVDSGKGISPENLGRIFEPLFTTKARGMGLGLAVSRALAVANGGDITVESREGEGAKFTLTLPIAGMDKAE